MKFYAYLSAVIGAMAGWNLGYGHIEAVAMCGAVLALVCVDAMAYQAGRE